jgi:hypothetical protein
MLLWMTLALAARPLFVQPEADGGFRVVDQAGDNVGAWHFAHFTRDHAVVRSLRLRLYVRRTSAILCLGVGAVSFASASIAVQVQRSANGYDGHIDPGITAAGVVAVAGLLTLVVHPTNVLMRRPDWLRVDTHYSREEAVARIQQRRRVEVWASPVGVYARF